MRVRTFGLLLAAALSGAATVRAGTYGMAGLDLRPHWGSYWKTPLAYLPLDPVFRAGRTIVAGLAVGAELSFIRTFPKSANPFLSTPEVAVGPTLGWFPRFMLFRPYFLLGLSALPQPGFPFNAGLLAGQTKLAAGALLHLPLLPIGFGLEVGWSHQAVIKKRTAEVLARGDNLFLGVRLVGEKR